MDLRFGDSPDDWLKVRAVRFFEFEVLRASPDRLASRCELSEARKPPPHISELGSARK